MATRRAAARKQSVRLLVSVVAIATWCVGCGTEPGAERIDPRADDPSSLQDAVALAIGRFDDAETRFGHCLAEAGFNYTPRRVEVEVSTASGGLQTRTEAMRQSGYGIVAGDGYRGVVATVTGGDVPSGETMGIEQATAPGGVCAGSVNTIDVQFELQKLAGEFDQLPDSLPSDPRFVAGLSEWRACMAERGFPFDSPSAAFNYVEDEFEALAEPIEPAALQELATKERLIAATDGECFDDHLASIVSTILEEQQ